MYRFYFVFHRKLAYTKIQQSICRLTYHNGQIMFSLDLVLHVHQLEWCQLWLILFLLLSLCACSWDNYGPRPCMTFRPFRNDYIPRSFMTFRPCRQLSDLTSLYSPTSRGKGGWIVHSYHWKKVYAYHVRHEDKH